MEGPTRMVFRRSSTCSRADTSSRFTHRQDGTGSSQFSNEYLLSTFNESDVASPPLQHREPQSLLHSTGAGFPKPPDFQAQSTSNEPGDGNFCVHQLGERGTATFRAVFRRRSDSCIISPWHDIPLYDKQCLFRCICTTPVGTSLQHCFSVDEPLTPLRCRPEELEASSKQPQHPFWHKALAVAPELASVSHFVSSCPWNVGVLPQTLHSEEDVFFSCPEFSGSGAPLEIIEISGRRAPLGAVYTVKPVAAFAVQSGASQFCWKIVGVAGDSPLAEKILTLTDVEKYLPGELQKVQDWLDMCCSYSASSEAFPSPHGPDEARVAVAQANATWQLFIEEAGVLDPVPAPCGLTAELLSSIWGSSAWLRSCHVPSEDPFADSADGDIITPTSTRSKAGGGAGFQGFGRLLRTASMRGKNSNAHKEGNPKPSKKQSSSRPPTAPHPTLAFTPATTAPSQQLPWQHTASSSSKEEKPKVRRNRRSSASVDMGANSCTQEPREHQAEHTRRKSDTTMVDGGWSEIMFSDGNSPSHPSFAPVAAVGGYPNLVRSPSLSPGLQSPARYGSPVDQGSPVNNLLLRKQTNLLSCREHGTPPKKAGSLHARSFNGNAEVLRVTDSQMESVSGIPRPRSSSMPRSVALAFAAQGFAAGLGEGGHVSPHGWLKGQSPSMTPTLSASSSPDITPHHGRSGVVGGWRGGEGGAAAAFPRSQSATAPRQQSHVDLSPDVTPSRDYPGKKCHRNSESFDGGNGAFVPSVGAPAVSFPRSRSATAPREQMQQPEAGVLLFGRMNSAGRRVSFSEEVDLVLLLEGQVDSRQDHSGEAALNRRGGFRRTESALHVSMPLAEDGEGPALGSPKLVVNR